MPDYAASDFTRRMALHSVLDGFADRPSMSRRFDDDVIGRENEGSAAACRFNAGLRFAQPGGVSDAMRRLYRRRRFPR